MATIKKFISLAVFALIFGMSAKAQVYDGITQPTRFRLMIPTTISVDDAKTTVAPMFGYKQDIVDWFNITGVVQYNVANKAAIPQIWLNFNCNKTLFFLSRSIYNTSTNKYMHTLSATYKIPFGFMVDCTWDNFFNGTSFCDTDRLQFVGGYAYKWFVVNAGYSCRNKPGFVCNLRLKVTDLDWVQLKFDQGAKSVTVQTFLQLR